MSYDDIYALKPVREVEPNWWKLRWRPLWRKTFSIYALRLWSHKSIGASVWWEHISNGWGRSYRRIDFRLCLIWWDVNAWIKWDYRVHKDGPFDVAEKDRRPLDIPTKGLA